MRKQLLLLCFIISLSVCWGAKTSRVDIEALTQLKASIDPRTLHTSSCLGSWDFSVDPCESASSATFFVCGIRCDEAVEASEAGNALHHRVTSLVLDGYGYRGTLSPFVGNLTALQVLDISSNMLTGQLPNTIGNLQRLTRLDVTGNRFTGSIPPNIGRLTSLVHLGLARNSLSGSIPSSIVFLTQLRNLYLHTNLLVGALPSMTSMSRLLYLDASGNQLIGPLQGRLPPSLLQLSLRSNRFTGQLPAELRSMESLMVLDLSRNLLTGGIGDVIFLHPSLQQVNVAGNRLAWLENSGGYNELLSSRLVALDASYNQLGGQLPAFLARLPRLSSLALTGNLLRGAIPLEYAVKAVQSLVGIQPLKRLYLDGNLLIGALPGPFLSWNSPSASFANNCLMGCPLWLPFCGAQRPPSQCRL